MSGHSGILPEEPGGTSLTELEERDYPFVLGQSFRLS